MKLQEPSSLKKLVFLSALAIFCGTIGFISVLALNGDSLTNYATAAKCDVRSCIALKGDHAEPAAVTISVGDSVQFNTADGKKHVIALGEGGEHHEHAEGDHESEVFGAGESYTANFDEAGTFELHDHENPLIQITVVVLPGSRK